MDENLSLILLIVLLITCLLKTIILCTVYSLEIQHTCSKLRSRNNKTDNCSTYHHGNIDTSYADAERAPSEKSDLQHPDADLEEFEKLEKLVMMEESQNNERARSSLSEQVVPQNDTTDLTGNELTSDNLEKRRSDLLKAMRLGDLEMLEGAIEWAVFDGYEVTLGSEIFEARNCFKQQNNLNRMREAVRDIRPSVVSELRSYAKPPKAVHDVMVCVYLLLGFTDEHQLKKWPSLQAFMNQSGKHNLKRLIDRRHRDDVTDDVMSRVREILKGYNFQHIYEVSEGAAVFYVWIMEMVEKGTADSVEKSNSDP